MNGDRIIKNLYTITVKPHIKSTNNTISTITKIVKRKESQKTQEAFTPHYTHTHSYTQAIICFSRNSAFSFPFPFFLLRALYKNSLWHIARRLLLYLFSSPRLDTSTQQKKKQETLQNNKKKKWVQKQIGMMFIRG